MGMYQVGEMIRRTRESLGISRKDLCDGICAIETLCRIETGKRIPSRTNFQALMERMGKNGEKYFPLIHGDMDILLKKKEITLLMTSRRYEEVEEKVYELEKLLEMNDTVNRQFILRMKALVNYRTGKINEKKKRQLLIEALKCTVPHFDGVTMPNGVFSRLEVMIYCNIAVSYAEEGQLTKAIELLRQEANYFNNTHIDMDERAVSEVFVLTNLARCLGLNNNIREAIDIDKKIVKLCLEHNKSTILPSVLYDIAYAYELLKDNSNYSRKKLEQAYYLAEFNENNNMMQHIKQHMLKTCCTSDNNSNYNKK